eukprot:194872-Chlamydomonas_euryale.AAC.2
MPACQNCSGGAARCGAHAQRWTPAVAAAALCCCCCGGTGDATAAAAAATAASAFATALARSGRCPSLDISCVASDVERRSTAPDNDDGGVVTRAVGIVVACAIVRLSGPAPSGCRGAADGPAARTVDDGDTLDVACVPELTVGDPDSAADDGPPSPRTEIRRSRLTRSPPEMECGCGCAPRLPPRCGDTGGVGPTWANQCA